MIDRRPLIGISSGAAGVPIPEGVLPSYYVGQGYVRAVAMAGGVPVVLAAVGGREHELAEAYVERIDGLVLAGGTDIDPGMYGAARDHQSRKPDLARDRLELALVREARQRDLPVLGVCRGFQLLDVAYGGALEQHRPHKNAPSAGIEGLRADATRVELLPGSRAAQVYGRHAVDVVCIHHQAVGSVGRGLVVGARSTDGLIESLEDPAASFVLGILWHPEQMLDRDRDALLAYEALIAAARERMAASWST